MNIELKHLQLVYNIELLGNLSRCAEAMHITQPAASHLLKNLELQIGGKVYDRINKKMVLTKAGNVLLNAAMDILPKMTDYKLLLSNEIHGKKGTIKIATECNTSYTWLPKVLKSFQNTYPGVEVEINVRATSDPLKYLQEGKIDLAILIDPKAGNKFEYHELFVDEVLLVVPKSHKLSLKNHVDADALIDESYIMYPEKFENNSVANKILIPKDIRPKKIIKLQLTEAIIEMVQAGMGITAMSNWLLKSYINNREIKTIRITKKGFFRKWAILSLKKQNPPYVKEFIRHFQVHVSP